MLKRRKISEEDVRIRRKAGMSREEIAEDLKCSVSQVRKVTEEGDYIYRGFYSSALHDLHKRPILQAQIDQLREQTPIGMEIWMEDDDPLWHNGSRRKRFRVVEKYPYICLLTDGKKRITMTWVEMVMEKKAIEEKR